MQESTFRSFLSSDPSITSEKAIISRMAKAKKAENILRKSLDEVVVDDDTMFESLLILQDYENPAHNPMQNAVRKYYIFRNGKDFSRLKEYHSPKHP